MGKENQQKLQSFVAQGWTTLAIVMLGSGFIKFMNAVLSGDQSLYTRHHDPALLEFLVVIFSFFALMTLVTRLLDQVWFRWLNVVLLCFAGIAMSLHMVHKMGESIMHGTNGAGNYIYQIVVLITVVQAVRWARSGNERHA
jgi:hypothetical protein